MKPGDLVLIYQARSGPSEIVHTTEGKEKRIGRLKGAEGIIAIALVTGPLTANGEADPTHYVGRKTIWWRWVAPIRILTRTGFVPRTEVNRALHNVEHWNLHGFGDRHSGLKKLTEQEYQLLADQFASHTPIVLPTPESSHAHPVGGCGIESEDHRLLKEYVAANPHKNLGEAGLKTLSIEYDFGTGDRADCVLSDAHARIIGVEVEVTVGDTELVGFLQAIKYRYMLEPLTKREPGDSRAFLIAYEISGKMKELCRAYGVECFVVPKNVVKAWAVSNPRK
jgi:hypothetical protein